MPATDDKDVDSKARSTPSPAISTEKTHLLGGKSPGVRRIEAISTQFTTADRVFVFIGIFLIAYAYGLDGSVRYTYQVLSTLYPKTLHQPWCLPSEWQSDEQIES